MKYAITINGVTESLDLIASAPETRFRLGEGGEQAANVEMPEPGLYSVLLDGRVYEARVEESFTGVVVFIHNHRFAVDVRDPHQLPPDWNTPAGVAGVQQVMAPMPGRVVRVLVQAGDAVTQGQGLVVVEAMKMQSELQAPEAGTIRHVEVAEGATVTAGQVLVTLD